MSQLTNQDTALEVSLAMCAVRNGPWAMSPDLSVVMPLELSPPSLLSATVDGDGGAVWPLGPYSAFTLTWPWCTLQW